MNPLVNPTIFSSIIDPGGPWYPNWNTKPWYPNWDTKAPEIYNEIEKGNALSDKHQCFSCCGGMLKSQCRHMYCLKSYVLI